MCPHIKIKGNQAPQIFAQIEFSTRELNTISKTGKKKLEWKPIIKKEGIKKKKNKKTCRTVKTICRLLLVLSPCFALLCLRPVALPPGETNFIYFGNCAKPQLGETC